MVYRRIASPCFAADLASRWLLCCCFSFMMTLSHRSIICIKEYPLQLPSSWCAAFLPGFDLSCFTLHLFNIVHMAFCERYASTIQLRETPLTPPSFLININPHQHHSPSNTYSLTSFLRCVPRVYYDWRLLLLSVEL